MQVSSQKILTAYASFKNAALKGETQADNPLGPMSAEIAEASVDHDPTTKDTLTATHWDGGFSSATDVYSFTEFQKDDALLLKFDYSQQGFGVNPSSGSVLLNSHTAQVLNVEGDALTVVEQSAPKPPAGPPEPPAPGVPSWIDAKGLQEVDGPISFDGTQRVYLKDIDGDRVNLAAPMFGDMTVAYVGRENNSVAAHPPTKSEASQLATLLHGVEEPSEYVQSFEQVLANLAKP
jgi:hypothetical protein